MAGEVEECITHQVESLSSGSISFGRFELESLSWEKRSSFSHNRYLEEVEKYSTPGSVTRKKEYFEAHFKKKALLHLVSVENQEETETKHAESSSSVDNDRVMEDFMCHGDSKLVEVSWDDRDAPAVSDEHEAVELQKEEMSLIENTGFPSFNSEKHTELFTERLTSDDALQSQAGDNGVHLDEGSLCGIVEDKTLDSNANSEKLADNRDASSKNRETKKKNASIQMKNQNVSMKISDTVEQKAGKSKFKSNLPTQQMSKKPSRNGSSVTYGKLKKADKQNSPAKLENQIPSKVSSSTSIENVNFKKMASRNMKAQVNSELKSEEGVRAKKAEVMSHPVERRASNMRQHVNRVKLISKAEDKQTSAVFKFKSSERAEKRKEYYLKLEEKLHAKEAEMTKIQARTEEVKEAEMKQFRKSLNFKATPMPSFYHETASKVSEGKKTSTILAKSPITQIKCATPPVQPSHEKSLPSPTSNQETPVLCEPHGSTQPVSPSVSSCTDKVDGTETSNYSAKKPDVLKGEEKGKLNSSQTQGNGMRKKEASKNRMRSEVVGKMKGIDGGNLAVHVAS
ncbi:protein WVD2-like 7 isoform X2 [Dendrobium catenatum]|uniref:protein WVD2-like 7 isoform X2 n=1 Tax=Dendrobium catenatum TaxID=906689 RepID=UPI0009F5FF0C|nr:protein WVD2-like 7 isoform X2 [Dendrobium catenatum]